MRRIPLLLLFVAAGALGVLAGTGSAQESEPLGIPRDAFVDRQYSFDAQTADEILVSAQAASQPPATIRNALLKGGVALVFGCYNSDSPNIAEFNAELPLIAAAGAGGVRLTCSMDVLENGTTGKVRADRYAQVLDFINLAWSYGLVTTVDVHNTGMRAPGSSDWTDNYMWGITNPSVAARHISLIVDLLSRLARDVPHDRFVFQPANEPIDQGNWYTYQQSYFPQLRAMCADCTIEVMARDWQGLEETVYSLNLSSFTGPIVVDVHFYEPIDLTHCSYPGSANRCGGQEYPGWHDTWRGHKYYDISWLRDHFALLKNWATQNGVFINIGEFGTTADLAQDVRARYLGDLTSVFREYGWGFTAYEWNKNFGIKQHPQVVSALFSDAAPSTPMPTVIVPTTPPSTLIPTIVPTTTAPTQQPSNFDIDELITLVQVVQERRTVVASAQSSVDSAQALVLVAQQNLSVAIQDVQNAEQALRDYILEWIGE